MKTSKVLYTKWYYLNARGEREMKHKMDIDEAIKKIRMILIAVQTSKTIEEAEKWVSEEFKEL